MTGRIAISCAAWVSWVAWVSWAGCAGCGDNLPRPGAGEFTPVSGSRLVLQKYRYDDGTEQAVSTEFYDTQLHLRCTAAAWTDGVARCVPSADDAAYTDPACTQAIGLGQTIAQPTHFVARDAAGGAVRHVFRAGAPAAPVAQIYTVAAGACVGPTPVPAGLTRFFAIGDEVDPAALVVFHGAEIAGDRLGLEIRETDDGLRVLSGLRDRALGAACVATVQGDGRVACEPVAAAASYFADPGCRQPVVAAAAAAEAPAIARIVEPSGCASYRGIGGELPAPVYRRDGDACAPADAPSGTRLFATGAAIEPAALGRSLESDPGRRLQRIVLDPGGPGGLRFADDRLFDTATGVDCRPRALRDTFRCLPADAIAATTLFGDAGCTLTVRVAEVPQHACAPPGFATTSRPFQIRAIGDVAAGLFRSDGGTCRPYAGAPGNDLRALGAAVDLATFASAIYYGER